MLEKATDLPQVVAVDVGKVVAVVGVVTVPEAYTDALRVDVVRNKCIGALRATGTGGNLDRARDS